MKQQHTLQPKLRFPEFKGDWEKKGLKDIGTINRGKSKHRPRNDKRLYGGDIPFIQTGDVNNDKLYITEYTQTYTDFGLSQSKLWDENTLCITIAANIANTSILKFKSCFPDSLIGFIANNQNDIIFVKYTFDKIREELKKLSQGVAQDNLNLEKLNSISTLIPSLPEQQKIADYLSTIDTKINLLEEKKAQLALYKKAMMQKLFTQEIRFKDDNGNDFTEWEEKSLGDISEINKGQQLNKENFIENGNFKVLNGGISYSGSTNNFNREGNLITISEGGNSCGYTNYVTEKFWLGGHCYALDNLKYNIYDKFLFQYLKFNESNIMRLRVGSGLPNIQKGDLSKLCIFIPSLPEQQKIADFLSAIDESIEKVNEQISQTQSFKKAMLQQMFV